MYYSFIDNFYSKDHYTKLSEVLAKNIETSKKKVSSHHYHYKNTQFNSLINNSTINNNNTSLHDKPKSSTIKNKSAFDYLRINNTSSNKLNIYKNNHNKNNDKSGSINFSSQNKSRSRKKLLNNNYDFDTKVKDTLKTEVPSATIKSRLKRNYDNIITNTSNKESNVSNNNLTNNNSELISSSNACIYSKKISNRSVVSISSLRNIKYINNKNDIKVNDNDNNNVRNTKLKDPVNAVNDSNISNRNINQEFLTNYDPHYNTYFKIDKEKQNVHLTNNSDDYYHNQDQYNKYNDYNEYKYNYNNYNKEI